MYQYWRVPFLALLIAAAGCAHNRARSVGTDGTEVVERPVRVHVVNHYGQAMEIVVVGAGVTQRLGLVAAGQSADFTIPPSVVGSGKAEFRAQPSGYGQVVRADPLVIGPGNIVDFEIATNLIGTRANVRP